MRPILLRTKLLQLGLERASHGDDTVGHLLDLTGPLSIELGVVEDLAGDAGTIDRWVAVEDRMLAIMISLTS